MLYDISRPLTPRTAVFPGDTAVSIAQVADMRQGASCNVSALTLSSHAGTHVDAPLHYAIGADGIDRVGLDVLIGPCAVITLDAPGDITLAWLRERLPLPLPARLVVAELRSGQLVELSVKQPKPRSWPCLLVMRADSKPGPIARTFIETLHAAAKKLPAI